MSERLVYESHSHTPLCKHAHGWPTEYAAVAEKRGLRGLIVTCHNPMPDGFSAHVRMSPEQFDEYVQLVADTRAEWEGRVDVRLGLEADYFVGYEDFVERQLASADFHYVLGSVHPQIAEFRNAHWNDDPVGFQRIYFESLAASAETKLFDCLAHPDLVKNETVNDWDVAAIMDDVILPALDRIAETGVAMELNTSGRNKRIPQMNPCPEMLVAMRERGIPVVLGADAHVPDRVADRYEEALDLLQSCGYERVSYFLERTRRELSIADARGSLVGVESL